VRSAGEASVAAANLVYPPDSFLPVVGGRRVDENQAIATCVERTPKLILILHDDAKGRGQLV